MHNSLIVSDFDIRTDEIFENERTLYYQGIREESQIEEFLTNLRYIIANKYNLGQDLRGTTFETPIVKVVTFNERISGNKVMLFDRLEKNFQKHSESVNYLIKTPVICENGDFISLIQPIRIDTTFELGFHYWFALKLSYYGNRLDLLDDFLDFHFELSFNKDIEDFNKFIFKKVIRSFDYFFSERLLGCVKEWLDKKKKKEELTSKSKTKEYKDDYRTFQLKLLDTNPLLFSKGDGVELMSLFYLNLKEKGFIEKCDDLNYFYDIFKDKTIRPENKIVWQGTLGELKYFVQSLEKSGKFYGTGFQKTDKWLIAIKCFSHRKKSGDPVKDIPYYTKISKAEKIESPKNKILDSIFAEFLNHPVFKNSTKS